MAQNSPIQRLRDGVAKRLWSGDVLDDPARVDGGVQEAETYHRRRSSWSPEQVSVSKAGSEPGLRRGRVPEHIESPIKGKPRSTNPLGLRKLAKSGTVQSNVGAILGDMEDIPWSVVPIDEDADPDDGVIEAAEENLRDLNPNPETFDDVAQMMGRDLLEVGNCAAVQSFEIDDRAVEAIPYDPSSFTADWDQNRVIQGFFQYPNAEQRWGDPTSFERDEVIWGVWNPTTTRAGFYGYSPVEIVERFINIMGGLVDKEVKELEEGMPSGLISLVGDEWSSENYSNFKTYWKNEVKGEQIKHPIAEGDAKFEPFNMTYKELQVLDRQQWYSKLVAAAFRVPVSETGLAIGQEMTRATDVSQRQKYKKRALGSLLSAIEDLFTYQHLHRWFSEDIRLRFDPGRDLMERAELSKIEGRYVRQGIKTINEIREEKGLDPVAWGDTPPSGGQGQSSDSSLEGGGGDTSGVMGDEESNQNALDEGTQQDTTPSQDGGDTGFSDGDGGGDATTLSNAYAGEGGTWLPADYGDVVATKALRSTDTPHQFSFQPHEIEALQEDVEALHRDAIEGVLAKVRGNQQLLRKRSSVSLAKNSAEFQKLIREEVGLSFAEEAAEVLTEHKTRKIRDGEEAILSELARKGVDPEDVALEQTRDRVTERIRDRSLKVTKPISGRLEDDLRDTLERGWTEGMSITEIEDEIEAVSDKWTGHESERLARDQMGRAAKEGRLEYAQATKSEVGGWHKSWIVTIDGRQRDSHAAMQGETVPADEPWIVDYSLDGGPARVEEDYPGDSAHGIQCRCDYELIASPTVANVRKWADDPTTRMREVAREHDKPIEAVMLGAELSDESRTAAAKRLDLSKDTYYRWCRESGLYGQ